MSTSTAPAVRLRELGQALLRHRRLWIAPTVLGLLAGVVYALIRPETWQASQAIVLRDEATGVLKRIGQFDDAEKMKTAQETLQELVKNRSVVEAALRDLPPPDHRDAVEWPTPLDIDAAQQAVSIVAPRGADFGHTEVLYLVARERTGERALELHREISRQLDLRLQQVRGEKAQSMLDELERSVHVAQADLESATNRLRDMETRVGSDLSELRSLNNTTGGEGELRRRLGQMNIELREAETRRMAAQQHHKLIADALRDPEKLVATPNQLLEAAPALRRLKDGLVDARLRTAELRGTMQDSHPRVVTAMAAEQEVARHLHRELETAQRGIQADLELTQSRTAHLENEVAGVNRRLDQLAELRATYNNLVDEVSHRNGIANQALKDLGDAKARHEAASATSLLTRVDEPTLGTRPIGPSSKAIIAGGGAAGLLTGLGLVFLVVPLGQSVGRRWSDRFFGRRATDQSGAGSQAPTRSVRPGGRRVCDPPDPPADSLAEVGAIGASPAPSPDARATW